MKFRKAEIKDADIIYKMYLDGSESLKRDEVNQWQEDEQPKYREIIENLSDIYILEDGELVSTVRIGGHDPQYDKIYSGSWITNGEYYSIHKVATFSTKKNRGYAKKMFLEGENMAKADNIKSIKIDTHEDNIKMQNFLTSINYKYCGIVYLDVEGKRFAYEKILE
ncbi:Acetyltransferase (GNAT) family protein [Anaerosphaera aminiphila DSM 21120]|uniref:Acetyltransferase (GNAT) family protein n=1 Tax=Anaerosphaera aminiphila DSM 21120 TaxID=1120995 RepID=A0A1M5RPR0_9FIRM|nr:GNAT family N-acetyltransferase [Anaerosphaera aminiphila]SHH28327.1 Acetyltransferase (GNAT) family protein [Anaerosphaera aminiphila DSM 21120]